MKIAVVVVMRMTSDRLPNKPFTRSNSGLVVDQVIENVLSYVDKSQVIFAISNLPSDNALENYLLHRGMNVFRGSETNVLQRFVEASKNIEADWYIRYNGDNLFHCPENFSGFLEVFSQPDIEVVTNTRPRSHPRGITFEAVRADILNKINLNNCSEYDKEHIFPAIYSIVDQKNIFNIRHNNINSNINLSLDTVQDSCFLKTRASTKFSYNEKDVRSLVEERLSFNSDNPFLGRNGVFTIAEIGGNHEGDFEYAKSLVDLAVNTDVDTIKLQIYSPDLIVNPKVDPDRNKHFGKFALPREQYIELLKMIRAAGKFTMASVWSVEELTFFEPYIDYLKVGSGDFTDKTILNLIPNINKPLVISAGLSEENQVKKICNYLTSIGVRNNFISLLQCTSMYPIPFAEANLNVISHWREIFPELTVGYSDHTLGTTALMASVARGAQVLEFHFTDNKIDRSFRDHLVSLESKDVSELISWIRANFVLGGDGIKRLSPSEISSRHDKSFRKALYPSRDLPEGHIIQPNDLIALRPEKGWPADRLDELVGKTLRVAKRKYDPINNEDL